MKSLGSFIVLSLFVPAAFAGMTVDQKVTDFAYLTGLFAKNYAPYEWKRDVIGFDLYNVRPWLDRVKASKDDLEYYDICVRYVASLQDSHDAFAVQSEFSAVLPIDLDIYDGKVLIEQIYRSWLPIDRYPFQVGDELVSVDGKAIDDVVEALIPYSAGASGSGRARRRLAAQTITYLRQAYYPKAPEVGENATLVVRDPAGTENTYVIPWIKSGIPLWSAGLVPSPDFGDITAEQSAHARVDSRLGHRLAESPNPWGVWVGEQPPALPEVIPPYLTSLRRLRAGAPLAGPAGSVVNGRYTPTFDPPPGFQIRLGSNPGDPFLTGTFPVAGHQVGFIRLPNMGALDAAQAPRQIAAEIAYFQAGTDALVIDVMHNQGGSVCYAENLAQYLMPRPFRGIASRLRATQEWASYFARDLVTAVSSNAPQDIIDLYKSYLAQILVALNENRGLTAPLPICTPTFETVQPARDEKGNLLAYTKPILVLVDELTRSAAENVPMFIQDEGRGLVLGIRTNGAGGAPATFPAGAYGGGSTTVTASMVTRAKPVRTEGFPTADVIENIGIYPDIFVDYMTRDNLMTGGKPFVAAFTQVVAEMIEKR